MLVAKEQVTQGLSQAYVLHTEVNKQDLNLETSLLSLSIQPFPALCKTPHGISMTFDTDDQVAP